ncbi:MAG: efflux RND transporter periplasmic adaptor subunit [Candidatus Xenobiia bacterium LiM19]
MSLLFIFSLLTGCEKEKENKNTMHPGPSSAAPVVYVANVFEKSVPIYGEYVASIDPSTGAEIVDVKARVEAFLLTQNFVEGGPVTQGQVLFTLDPSTYEANLKSAEAQLMKGKADLEMAVETVAVDKAKADLQSAEAQLYLAQITEKRQKPLAEKKAVPQQDYDNALSNLKVATANVAVSKATLKNTILQQKVDIEQAKAEIASAKAAIDNAKINLSYCTVRSPLDGVAGKRLVAPGNLVGHGEATVLTQVSDLDPVRVNFNISETDYLNIRRKFSPEGDKRKYPPLELILADGRVYNLKGRIALSEPTLDPKTGTLNVVGEFANPHWLLRPGMFGRIRVTIDFEKNAVLMPLKSIVTLQSAKIVYVVDENNKVALRNVSLGPQIDDSYIVVMSGVKPGERVITEGMLKVRPEMEVKPEKEPAKSAGKSGSPGMKPEKPEKGEK